MKKYKEYDDKIIAAIEEEDVDGLTSVLAQLKKKRIDINQCMSENNYIETVYEARAPEEFYALLLRAGASSTEKINSDNFPLFQAGTSSRAGTARALIRNGANVNIWGQGLANWDSYLEGYYAVDRKTGKFTEFDYVTDENCPKDKKPIRKPLVCAMIKNYYNNTDRDVVMELLDRPDLNLLARDSLKDNAYSYAVAYGDTFLLEDLERLEPKIINHGKNNNLLNIAIASDNYDTMRYLLENKKVNINAKSRLGREDALEKLLKYHNSQVRGYVKNYSATASNLGKMIKQDEFLITLIKMFELLNRYGVKFSPTSKKYYATANKMKYGVLPRSVNIKSRD